MCKIVLSTNLSMKQIYIRMNKLELSTGAMTISLWRMTRGINAKFQLCALSKLPGQSMVNQTVYGEKSPPPAWVQTRLCADGVAKTMAI